MNRIFIWIILVAGVLPVSLYVYSSRYYMTFEKTTAERSALLENNEDETIQIGVVWNDADGNFMKGAESAVAVLNNDKFNYFTTDDKKSVKRNLELVPLYADDKNNNLQNATKIAKHTKIAAVIGHHQSDIAVPASITYQYNGIPYLSPVATSNVLTQHNFSYVFRNAPRDSDFTKALIKFCKDRKYKNVAVIYCRDTYGFNFSSIFVEAAAGLSEDKTAIQEPVNILLQKSYAQKQKVFLPMIAEIIESKADCIFIAGQHPEASLLIKQIRQMGLRAPIIGGDGIEDANIVNTIGQYVGEIYVASVFDRNYKYPDGSMFANAKTYFKEKFKIEPDYDASQGFEAVYILAQAFKQTQSSHPLTITSFMKVFDDFKGINGTVSFSQDGDIEGKPVFIKQLVNGNFDRIVNEKLEEHKD